MKLYKTWLKILFNKVNVQIHFKNLFLDHTSYLTILSPGSFPETLSRFQTKQGQFNIICFMGIYLQKNARDKKKKSRFNVFRFLWKWLNMIFT